VDRSEGAARLATDLAWSPQNPSSHLVLDHQKIPVTTAPEALRAVPPVAAGQPVVAAVQRAAAGPQVVPAELGAAAGLPAVAVGLRVVAGQPAVALQAEPVVVRLELAALEQREPVQRALVQPPVSERGQPVGLRALPREAWRPQPQRPLLGPWFCGRC